MTAQLRGHWAISAPLWFLQRRINGASMAHGTQGVAAPHLANRPRIRLLDGSWRLLGAKGRTPPDAYWPISRLETPPTGPRLLVLAVIFRQ